MGKYPNSMGACNEMLKTINIEQYLNDFTTLPLVDVRSPIEFEKGHIPNAINVPIFSNEERAEIGTAYKQESRERAIEIGLKYVQPKLQSFIQDTLRIAKDKTVVVHCWRGGMRSNSFAQHLIDNGFSKVLLIEKGYKGFRKHAANEFEKDAQLVIIGGYTGSAKTELLNHIQNTSDKQVIDLEGLANHKGSAFGGIDQAPQPTVEQFENNLFWIWKDLNLNEPILLEDESRAIGSVLIPHSVFANIKRNRLYFLDIPREERVKHLVSGYGECNTEKLIDSIHRISSRLGGLNTSNALKHLEKGELHEVAKIALLYYDKFYSKGVAKRDPDMVTRIPLNTTDPATNSIEILNLLNKKQEQLQPTSDHPA
jgi:tRNA 2-selenouridine synthase